MKKTILALAALVLPLVAPQAQTVTKSPDGNLALTFLLAEGGVPTYSFDYKGRGVILPSRLGFYSHATSMPRVAFAETDRWFLAEE